MTSISYEPSELLDAVRAAVIGQGSGDTTVLDVELTQKEDEAGENGWRLTLLLPRPEGSAWSPESTGNVKRAARQAFDAVTDQQGLSLEAPTVVVVSTRQAPPSEIAAEEELSAEAGSAASEGATSEEG